MILVLVITLKTADNTLGFIAGISFSNIKIDKKQ